MDPDNISGWRDISIHALVKRATALGRVGYCSSAISIHALVKRATVTVRSHQIFEDISIHALVKRATGGDNVTVLVENFNPRPREEGDM